MPFETHDNVHIHIFVFLFYASLMFATAAAAADVAVTVHQTSISSFIIACVARVFIQICVIYSKIHSCSYQYVYIFIL